MQNQNHAVAASSGNILLELADNWREQQLTAQGYCDQDVMCGQCCWIFSPEITESRVCPDCGADVPEVQL